MIYIELENNTPVKSTSNAEIACKYFKNIITTDYSDYTPTNKKYKYENGEIILNPNYETERIKQEQTARIEEIKQELNELDKKRIRAMWSHRNMQKACRGLNIITNRRGNCA